MISRKSFIGYFHSEAVMFDHYPEEETKELFWDGLGVHMDARSSKPEKKYEKYDECFEKQDGVCYTDNDGNGYTYNNLMMLVRDEENVKHLYEYLNGDTPEKTLESSISFQKCDRCGAWEYREFSFRNKGPRYCRFCTPLRTGGKIDLWKDPYDDDRKFFSKNQAVFEPGITTLVGCNGAGKTTLLNNIKEELKKRGTPCIDFDNLGDEGGENGARNLLGAVLGGYRKESTEETIGFFSESLASSEGEKIACALSRFTAKITRMIRQYSGYGELWVLFDALDSGFSIDMIEDAKKYVLDPINSANKENFAVYIILSSNSYEMSVGTKCFSIEKMKYIPVKSFNAFRSAVLSSRKYKEKRDDVFRIKAEIGNRPYDLVIDEELWKRIEKHEEKGIEGDVLTMELPPFRFVIQKHCRNYSYWDTYSLYRNDNGKWKKIRCDVDDLYGDFSRIEHIKEDVHAYLCQKVFLHENRKAGK